MSVIVILGASNDCHALHMLHACHAHGLAAVLFDTSAYPQQHGISWDPQNAKGSLRMDACAYRFEDIGSVFWSSIHQPLLGNATHLAVNQIAMSDSCSALRTFFDESSIHWVNSWQVFDSHKVKPRQLQQAAIAGALLPKTYIGNDQAALVEFVEQAEHFIVKPVYGGAHACLLSKDMLRPEHLHRALRHAPVTIQQYIEGENIRTFVIKDSVYSAVIVSSKSDFRLDPDPQHIPIPTPQHIDKLAVAICRRLGMVWTAIDWRRDSDGQYYFLEANPSPMFIHFENMTGYPITQQLLTLLDESEAPQLGVG